MRGKLVIGVVFLGIIGVYIIMLNGAGFFKPIYWEKHRVVYDPLLKRDRCIDKISGEIMELDPPCAILTMKGREAVDKRKDKCVRNGGAKAACDKESQKWIMSQLEKPKLPQKTSKSLYDRDQ